MKIEEFDFSVVWLAHFCLDVRGPEPTSDDGLPPDGGPTVGRAMPDGRSHDK